MKTQILGILFTAAFVVPALAGKAVMNTSKEPTTGRIVYVHANQKSLSVKAKDLESSTGFKISAATKVTLDGVDKTAADITKGLYATVTPKADDLVTAATITLSAKPITAPAPTPAPAPAPAPAEAP